MDVTPEMGNRQRAHRKFWGGRTGEYQESRNASVLSKLDICIEPVTDHYRAFGVKVVPIMYALVQHFKKICTKNSRSGVIVVGESVIWIRVWVRGRPLT